MKSLSLVIGLVGAVAATHALAIEPPTNVKSKAQVYTLEPKAEGIVCENGKLDWPSELKFPAGLRRINVPVERSPDAPVLSLKTQPIKLISGPMRDETFTLNFHILKSGRLTQIVAGPGVYGILGNEFMLAWAAGWSLGPQAETLKGCKMTWAVRADHSPEIAYFYTIEALHLRNYMSGLPRTDPRSDACREADKNIRTRIYADRRAMRRLPGRSQQVMTRYDVLPNGKVKLGGQIKAEAQPADVAEIVKALSQRNFYPGSAAQDCIASYAIPPAPLPVEDSKELWPQMRALYPGFFTDEGSKDCPNDDLTKVMPFVFNAAIYPAEARRLKIEGVASVRFDIAPWGEVRVRSSWAHPLPQFGRAAEQMVLQSPVLDKTLARGYSGCQVIVRFTNPADPVEDKADAES